MKRWLLLLLVILNGCSADWWLTPDQQGRRAFEGGDYGAAAKNFEDSEWKGVAAYRAGDYEAAVANRTLFYPINIGTEEASWERFHNESIDKFFDGTFKGDYQAALLEEFERIRVPSHIATDDGSAGFHGFVTDHASHWIEKNNIDPTSTLIYGCGPEPMLAATARLAEHYRLPCQVSMERMMACGIGLCQSCAVEVKTISAYTKYHLCCKDGPVFNAEDVVWQVD